MISVFTALTSGNRFFLSELSYLATINILTFQVARLQEDNVQHSLVSSEWDLRMWNKSLTV